MKTMRIVFIVFSWVAAAAVPVWCQGTTLGVYQSSLDGQRFELRMRGELALDIYSLDGRLLTTIERKKATEDFKGKTQTLATRCPQNSGKIEAKDVAADHIHMRVEIPSPTTCNLLSVFSKWQDFDLVKDAGGATALPAAPSQPSSIATSSGASDGPVTVVSLKQIQFQVTGAVAEGGVLTVTGFIFNQGSDRLVGSYVPGQGPTIELIDDLGKTHTVTLITIGNQQWRSEVLNGVRTEMVMTFREMETRAGVVEASSIRRLSLKSVIAPATQIDVVEFRNIPIRKNVESGNASTPPITTPNPPQALPTSTFDSIQFQVTEAVAMANNLAVTITALNQGPDRHFLLRNDQTFPQLIDDNGLTYTSATVMVGNQQWQADLLNGVKTRILLTFRDMNVKGGVLEANEIKRLTLPAIYVGNDTGKLEFRDIPIRKNPQ